MTSEAQPPSPTPDTPAAPAPKAAPTKGGPLNFLKEAYTQIDRRLLGLFRIYFGIVLLVDVLRRIPDATFFYSNEGALSNHFTLYAPLARSHYFSLFNAFSTPGEIKLAFLATACVYVMYILGYRTKLMQILAFVLYTSTNTRNLFVENGGCVSLAILTAWTAFMPLGDRFSIDSLLKRLRARNDYTVTALNDRTGIEPPENKYFTIVAFAIAIEIAAVYFFNTVHKNGATWKAGEAVHWVLWQNRIATIWAAWLRMHEPAFLSPALSYGTLVIEGLAPLFVLLPFAQRYLRTIHFVGVATLHISIAMLVSVGPFSYAMLGLNFMILPPAVFNAAERWLRQGKIARTIVVEGADAGLFGVARILSRLDTFNLLTFVDNRSPAAPEGTREVHFASVVTSTNTITTGTDGVIDATRSLPLGRVISTILGLPVIHSLVHFALKRRNNVAVAFDAHPASIDAGAMSSEIVQPIKLFEKLFFRPAILREAAAGILLFAVLIQISKDNWWVPKWMKFEQPAPLAAVIEYPRLLQGWTMFAPEAPRQDGTIVVDAITQDGRHIDPFTKQAPDFDAPLHGPWYMGQLWCDYFLKIHWDGNKGYREELKKYLLNWQRLEGRPAADRITSFQVWWISNDAPPPGSTQITNIQKTLVMEHKGNTGPQVSSARLSLMTHTEGGVALKKIRLTLREVLLTHSRHDPDSRRKPNPNNTGSYVGPYSDKCSDIPC